MRETANDTMAEFDLAIGTVASGPVRSIAASGFALHALPSLHLPPVDRDWLVVSYLESPELFDRSLADLCRVAGIAGGPIDGTPYFAVAPGGAVRLLATRAVEAAYHATLLFAPQRPPAEALAALGIEPAEHWTPKRLGDGLYVECWDRAATLYAESQTLVRTIVNALFRLATGVDRDHASELRIDLAAHDARYTVEEGPSGPRVFRTSRRRRVGLPEAFVATDGGWVLEPMPALPGAPRRPASRPRAGRGLRRLLEAAVWYPVVVLVRAALLPPSAVRRVRRIFR